MPGGKKITLIIWLGVFYLLHLATGVKTGAASLSGSFAHDSLLRHDGQSGEAKYAGTNRLRLNVKYLPKTTFKVEGSFDLLLLLGDNTDVYLMHDPAARNRLFMVGDTSFLPLWETRKLYFSLFFDDFTFSWGRQIINYGVGHVFSPVAFFAEEGVTNTEFSREGLDNIARIQVPCGDLSGFEIITTIPQTQAENISALKIFGHFWDYDWGLIGIYKKEAEEIILGLTGKGDLYGAGVRGELVNHYYSATGRGYFEGMCGLDYSLYEGKVLLWLEYYFDNKPNHPAAATDYSAAGAPVTEADSFFAQVDYLINELSSFSLCGTYEPVRKNSSQAIQFAYNVFPNTNLVFYIQHKNSPAQEDLPPISQTEFGLKTVVAF